MRGGLKKLFIREAKIAILEQQLKSLAIDWKCKDLSLAANIRKCNGSSKSKSVTERLTQIEQCTEVSN
jgi:hypothetical protein